VRRLLTLLSHQVVIDVDRTGYRGGLERSWLQPPHSLDPQRRPHRDRAAIPQPTRQPHPDIWTYGARYGLARTLRERGAAQDSRWWWR